MRCHIVLGSSEYLDLQCFFCKKTSAALFFYKYHVSLTLSLFSWIIFICLLPAVCYIHFFMQSILHHSLKELQ